jgi:hypothetical protein
MAFIAVFTLMLGYLIGRADTIRQAELIDVTNAEYRISFDGEIHTYTFD